VVPRRVARRASLAALTALLLLALLPALGSAANRRVAISDYSWSDDAIQLDLGEHVTWYWTGPDTLHSVTGDSPNAVGLDSDPGSNNPNHKIGDSFALEFDQPGTYAFRCKLHALVRGTVTVSANPGDPVSEPDPVPKSTVDLRAPRITDVGLGARRFGRRGTNLRFGVGETARLSADYYRYDASGHRHFTGYSDWPAHTGMNGVRLAEKRKHFNPRPGSYLAVLTATDEARNVSEPRRVTFHIRRR